MLIKKLVFIMMVFTYLGLGYADTYNINIDNKAPKERLFNFLVPQDQQTFHNQRLIKIDLQLQPDLSADEKVQLLVDDEPLGKPVKKLPTILPSLNRGAHKLQAQLLTDDDKVLLSTPTVTIYVHYAHLLPKKAK